MNEMDYCGRAMTTKPGFPSVSRHVPTGVVHLPENRSHIEVLDETGTRHRIDAPSGTIRQVAAALAISPASDGLENTLRNVFEPERSYWRSTGARALNRGRGFGKCSHHDSD
ncbi:hypothetical protein [Mesorhizobium sp. M0047]|uniref:hypothetical protein n=1 Tax=Mesorhizobium sp. M0047 TaxID=2956859 RepID=UPI0033367E32